MEWTRKHWKKKHPRATRQMYAKANPLAWVLEYQPQIRLPSKGFLPFEPHYAQQAVLRDRSQFRALNKSRQLGFTTTFAIESLHDFIYTPAAEIIVLSKSEKEAKKFLDKFYDAYHSVRHADPHVPRLEEDNKFNAVGSNGATIDVLTSSRGAGRSFSATRSYFDEMAHTQYADEIYDASLPTLSITGGAATLFSSPRGRIGRFYETITGSSEDGYSKHQYEWWFSPQFNPYYGEFLEAYLRGDKKAAKQWIELARSGDWYQMMRPKYSEMAWKQEYECNFDVSLRTVFTRKQLQTMFRRNYLGAVEDDPLAPQMFSSDPKPGHHYVTGVDLGRKRDATVIVTFDVSESPCPLVEYKRLPPSSSDWGLIELAVRATHDKFKSEMIHDASGAGDPISELLVDISEPFVITHGQASRAKYHIVENLRRAADEQAIVLPRIEQLYKEFEGYEWDDKAIIQDSVMAVALAVMSFYEPDTVFTGADPDVNYAGA